MRKSSFGVILLSILSIGIHEAFSADIPIEGYNYSVTDIKSKGLNAQRLFNSLRASGMDLEHSICSNRSYVWSYDLHRKFGINTGTIFIFFGARVWAGEKHEYWYHAGTYVVEDGKELVLEKSYPEEVSKPLTVVEWMDNEMEGRVNAAKCVELKRFGDEDITKLFYYHNFLPNRRKAGLPAYDCYYRKVPGYIPYPEMVAELDLGVDENGEKIDYNMKGYDRAILQSACVDSYSGRNIFKKGQARSFCSSYI